MTKVNLLVNILRNNDADFAKDFDSWYEEFKIGEVFKQARVEVALTHRKPCTRYKILDLTKLCTYFGKRVKSRTYGYSTHFKDKK